MEKNEFIKSYFLLKDFPYLRDWLFNSTLSNLDIEVSSDLYNLRNEFTKYRNKGEFIGKKKKI